MRNTSYEHARSVKVNKGDLEYLEAIKRMKHEMNSNWGGLKRWTGPYLPFFGEAITRENSQALWARFHPDAPSEERCVCIVVNASGWKVMCDPDGVLGVAAANMMYFIEEIFNQLWVPTARKPFSLTMQKSSTGKQTKLKSLTLLWCMRSFDFATTNAGIEVATGRLTCFAIADVMQYIHRSYKKAFLHVDESPLSGYFVQRSVRDVLNGGTPDPYLELLFSGKDAMTRSFA